MEILRIKETCLYVTDLDRTEAFYKELMELPVIGKVPGRHVFFRVGTSVLLCFIGEKTRQETTLPPHYGQGQLHLAFEVPLECYESWKQKLREASVAILHEHTWKRGMKSFYFHDPDGHLLEVLPEGALWE
jgi:catechol 2,3-dioxygenase-like lactoylglutathione lyase family enzyme